MKLSNEQDAIRLAVEAGYRPFGHTKRELLRARLYEMDSRPQLMIREGGYDESNITIYLSEIFSDPAFWQALGKARGWGKEIEKDRICLHCGVRVDTQPPFSSGCNHGYYPDACKVCSLAATDPTEVGIKCFETLLSGGDMKAFWELLP